MSTPNRKAPIDRIGSRFSNLLVISKDRVEDVVSSKGFKYSKTFYICKCDCGKEVSVQINSLTSGNTKSCGCLRKKLLISKGEDLTNQKFGRITVASKTDGIGSFWNCICDCGETKVIKAERLKSGNTNSCGCLQKEKAALTFRKISRDYRISMGQDPDKPLMSDDQADRQAFKPIAKEVYKRDSHACIICNKNHCMLNAHHIRPWAIKPELRFDKNNVVTLCVDCHKIVHKGNYNAPPDEIFAILLEGYTKVIQEYINPEGGAYDLL